MIRINLLPVRQMQAEVGRRQDLMVAVISVACALALVFGAYLYQSHRLARLNEEVAGLKKEIAALNSEVKGVAEMQQRIAELRGKLKVIDELHQKRTGPVRLMEGLTTATPARLWLVEFRERGGDLSLIGIAVDNQTVAEFLKALAALPYFRNVELIETAQFEQEGIPLKKFSVRARAVYQPTPPGAPAPAVDGEKK